MYDQTGKLWFKIMAFIVLEAFLFTIADISWAANYRDQRGSQQMLLDSQKNKNEKDNVSAEALSNQLVLTQPAMPYMGFGQITPQGQELESVSLIDTTISGLSIAGNDLSDIFKTLKSSGCSVSEAGFGAMRQGFNKKEIYHSLISAGYDKEEVKTLLGSLLIMEEEIKKDEEEAVQTKTGPPQAQSEQAKTTLNQKKAIFEIPSLTDLPVEKDVTKVVEKTVQQGAVLRQTVEFVRLMLNEGKRGKELIRILKKSGLSNERITTALAQLGFNLKDIISILKDSDISCTDIVQAIYNSQINYSDKDIYTALLKAGFSDEEIISALKTVGMNAVDILKLTTELGRNMIQVADAMVKAGFNVAEIANAYVLKAMKWTWDNSVNVINCAVKAFDAFLTNIGKKFSSKQDLAYELIIDDILATGEVLIQDQDVMTSMAAIKNVAQNHGIDLQGYNLSLDSLLELEGVSVVHLDGNHWVTLVGVEGDQVTIIDNGKEEVISLSEFQIRWDGNVLAVNQQEINQNKLLDLQMRDIRGGRGFNPFKAISNVFKGVVEGVKTFVQGVVNIVKGAVQMAIATVTLDWERFKTGFWTATMGTFQTLTAPIVTLYHFLPESVARIVGMVIKTIIIAVFTVIGGIIGTILGGNTNAGMAIGAFVGTIVGYCFDYDMVMACKNNDVDAFKVVFKRMIIEAVVNAAVAFCMSYASVPGGSGTVAGNIASTTTAATAGAGVGATTGTMISTAVSSQAVQNLVVSAAVSALKQTLVTYALTYSMDAAGVTNPYLRAISVGAAGAWAGGDAGKISFTETGGWQMADLMSKHIAKQMVVGAVTSVSMEAIKQQGYEQGWDPLVTECAALAVGTFANIGISSGLGLQNNLKAPAQTSFTSLVVSNFQSSIGGLIGALAAKVVDRICLENGVDPILSAALSSTVENLTGSLSTAAFSDQKSFSMTDLGNALKSGLGAGLSAAYKDVLIRNFDYSEREASEAVYNTSVVASTVTKFYDAFSSDKAITTQEFNSKLDNLMQSAFTSGLEGLGFNNGFNGKMSSYEQVEYLDTWDQEIDTMEYLMTAQGSGIYLDDAGVYRNADGSENTYLNRNKARSDYNQEWKEKKPEVFDTKKSSSSDTASGNLSFGDALTKTIDTRMLSFQTTQASANFTTAVNRLHVNYNISQINSTADKLGVTAQLANGGGVMLTLTQQVLNNPALRDTALTNLLNYGTNATMLYGATTDNITGIMFDNSDSFFTGTASAYQQENNGKLEWARPETVETGSNTYIKAGVKADTVYDLVNNQNLSFVATQTNSFANMTSTNAFILNGNVSYDQTNGTFFLQNASFTALNGLKTVDFSTKLTNGDKVYASVVSDQGFNNTVLRTGTGQSADVYKTQLGGVAKELRIEDITSKASDKVSSLEVALTVSVSGNLNLESASLKEVNNRLTTEDKLVADIINLPSGCVVENTRLELGNSANGLAVTAVENIAFGRVVKFSGEDAKITSKAQFIYNRDGKITSIVNKNSETGENAGVSIQTQKGNIILFDNQISFANQKTSLLSNIGSYFGLDSAQEFTIVKGEALAVTNYQVINSVEKQQSGAAGAAGETKPGLNKIILIGDANGNQYIQKGSLFTIENNNWVIKDNDVIHNTSGKAITVSGKAFQDGEIAAAHNGNVFKATIADNMEGRKDIEYKLDVSGFNLTSQNTFQTLNTTVSLPIGVINTNDIYLTNTGALTFSQNIALQGHDVDGLFLSAAATTFAITSDSKLEFSQIGLSGALKNENAAGLKVGDNHLTGNTQLSNNEPSETTLKSNVIKIKVTQDASYYKGGEVTLTNSGLVYKPSDILEITGLGSSAPNFNTNTELFSGSFVSVGNLKITTDGSYKITQNSLMSENADSKILITLTNQAGKNVDAIMNLQAISIPDGNKTLDYYAPDFKSFSKEAAGMSFNTQGIEFTIKDNGANKFEARSEAISSAADIKLKNKDQVVSNINFKENAELTISALGSIVTADDVSFGQQSTMKAGAEVKVNQDKSIEIISGQINLSKADALQGEKNVATIQPAKNQETNKKDNDTKPVYTGEAKIDLLGNNKYNLYGDLSFNKTTGVYLADNTKVNITNFAKNDKNFVAIGNTDAVKGTFGVNQGQITAIEKGAQILEHITKSGEYITLEYNGTKQIAGKSTDQGWKINASQAAIDSKESWAGTIQGQAVNYSLARMNNETIIQINNGAGIELKNQTLNGYNGQKLENVDVTVTQKLANGQFVYTTTDSDAIGFKQLQGTSSGGAASQMLGKTVVSISDSLDNGNKIRTYGAQSNGAFSLTFTADQELRGINVVEQLAGSSLQIVGSGATVNGEKYLSGTINYSWNKTEGQVQASYTQGTTILDGKTKTGNNVLWVYNASKDSVGKEIGFELKANSADIKNREEYSSNIIRCCPIKHCCISTIIK